MKMMMMGAAQDSGRRRRCSGTIDRPVARSPKAGTFNNMLDRSLGSQEREP